MADNQTNRLSELLRNYNGEGAATSNLNMLAQGLRSRNKEPMNKLKPVTMQDFLDNAALATSPLPILGDVVGLGADAYRFGTDPSSRTPLNFGLAALGALPFIPSGLGNLKKSVDLASMKVVDVFGNGKQVKYYDNNGRFIEKFTSPSGAERWIPGVAGEKSFLDNYLTDITKGFSSPDEAYAKIPSLLGSQTKSANYAAKYGGIPKTWDSESKSIAKNIIDSGFEVNKYSQSTQSKSKYIELADGRKIRLSNHDLPSNYESADIDYRFGGDIKSFIDSLR